MGVIQELRQEFLQEGMQLGTQQGIQQGIQTKAAAIAKNMLSKGYTYDTVKDLTGLSREELERLQAEDKGL